MRLNGLLIAGILLAIGGTIVGNPANADDKKLKFYINFIGDPEIQFFAVVKRGVEDAGKDGAGLLPFLQKGTRVVCQNPGPAQIVQTVRCDGLRKFLEKEIGATVDTLVNTASTPAEGLAV